MTPTTIQRELFYFIPTPETIRRLLAELDGTPVQDEDFTLCRNRHAPLPWRWEGKGRYVGQRSPQSFTTQAEAFKDAQSVLSNA